MREETDSSMPTATFRPAQFLSCDLCGERLSSLSDDDGSTVPPYCPEGHKDAGTWLTRPEMAQRRQEYEEGRDSLYREAEAAMTATVRVHGPCSTGSLRVAVQEQAGLDEALAHQTVRRVLRAGGWTCEDVDGVSYWSCCLVWTQCPLCDQWSKEAVGTDGYTCGGCGGPGMRR